MIAEADSFQKECDALAALLAPLGDADYGRATQFKDWTIDDIMAHLNSGDVNARQTLLDPAAFVASREQRQAAVAQGTAPLEYQRQATGGLSGKARLAAWRASAAETANAYRDADPKQRVEWVGPSMSARSSITARLMETWSHAQAIYDLLGVERIDDDRIHAIAHLGAITFGWTFANRGEAPPGPPPHVRLQAPSGAIWEWNAEAGGENRVEGPATAFCQVVAQTRNIADVDLVVTGPVATEWMAKAQCFAGKANDPPPPGARFRQTG